MKRFLLLITFVALAYTGIAQSHGSVNIEQDDRVEALVSKQRMLYRIDSSFSGYRIHIFMEIGNEALDNAKAVKAQFERAFPDIPIYLTYVQIALSVTCDPDDEVIVFEPFYTNYNSFALQNDVKLVPITTHIEDGFALPPMSEVEKHITPKTKGVVICNPGNPTGCLYTKEALLELGEIAKKYGLFIFADEVYREFCYTDAPHFSCMHIPGLEQNVILLDSVSKRYSLCGARIGYLVSRNKEVMAAVMRYAQARLCSPSYGQIAAEGALDAPASYFKAVRDEYIHRRDVLIDGLQKMKGVIAPRPMGAFYAAAELPVDDAEKFAKWLLEEFSYNGETVMVAPMAGFYATPGLGRNQIRLAYVLKEEDLKHALVCLEKALETYPGRVK